MPALHTVSRVLGPRHRKETSESDDKDNNIQLPVIRIPASVYDFYKSAAQTYIDNKDGFSSKLTS